MKRISLFAFTLLALTVSSFSADKSSGADYPLGVFNFDFARLGADEAAQISELKSLGYQGLVLNLTHPKWLKTLKQYQAVAGNETCSEGVSRPTRSAVAQGL